MKLKIAIIGSGAFGLAAAIKLSQIKNSNIFVFEQHHKPFYGATFANHNRHHYGFHYPKSQLTIDQINKSKEEFENQYFKACRFDFKNLYAISRESKNVTSQKYENFLDKNKLIYQKVKIDNKIFNNKKISSVYEVHEGIYDFDIFRKKILLNLKNTRVKIKTNHELIKINKRKSIYDLSFNYNGRVTSDSFDIVINATYSNINKIISMLKMNNINLEYNLQELSIISFNKIKRIGVTIMDGNYPSILPLGNTNFHLFAHVVESQLKKENSKNNNLFQNNFITTNFINTINVSKKYIKLLDQAVYHKSIISCRVVNNNKNDTRKSEIIKHTNNFYSIFGAKIITCMETANNIYHRINNL